MPITNIATHDDHIVRIHLTRGLGTHYAALRCVDCNKHIQWLSQEQVRVLNELRIHTN